MSIRLEETYEVQVRHEVAPGRMSDWATPNHYRATENESYSDAMRLAREAHGASKFLTETRIIRTIREVVAGRLG